MSDPQREELLELLRDIHARQGESLDMQREQHAMAMKQFERAERLNKKAEQIQERSAQMMGAARKLFIVVVPIIILTIIYLSWLLFR